ncbi:MAG: tetratricopeptide repeat protein [Bacteroidales bacterium]|nr:tetratricopeptide repeat protein [Bacteroidales bacterium]
MSFNYRITILAVALVAVFAGCSNTKNTASRRAFHNLTSHYNVYFNAREYYNEGVQKIETDLQCDYTEILPVFKVDAPGAADMARGDMESCIQKCGKNILTHSITAKPKKHYGRGGMDQSELEFYNKPDFCKWIDDTYLLMGKANYVAADYDRAESSFRLVTTRFKHEPAKFEAQMWLAKTMSAQKNYTEALEIINKLNADKRHPKKLDRGILMTYADIYIAVRQYDEALEALKKAVEITKNKNKRAWLVYIMGDINRRCGNYNEARQNYLDVIKINPDYATVFNAKINLATVFEQDADVDKIISDLQKLARDENNAEYKDQIYYAIAEVYRRSGNIDRALDYYKLSAHESRTNDIQKAKSYLASANIYFDRHDYINAQKYYDSTMSYLPKTYSDYDEISQKSENLSLLTGYINQANYQDSIQRVATMHESRRNQIVTQIIAQVAAEEAAANQPQQYYGGGDNSYGVQYTGQDGNPNFAGKWYLYNTTSLNYGKSEFIKKWGQRRLEDNWRRKNKGSEIFEETEQEATEDTAASAINNKMPEYYLRNLPMTDSAMTISKNIEADSWFAAADVYYEKMDDPAKAIETLLYLNQKNPDHYLMPQSLYTLYKLYNYQGEKSLAEYTKTQLISNYPESGYAKILGDPNYQRNVQARKDSALSVYNNALNSFQNGMYQNCILLCTNAETKYADLKIAENFYYLEARAHGRMQNIPAMRSVLETFVKRFPKSDLNEAAQNKLSSLNSGRFDIQRFDTLYTAAHYFVLAFKTDNPAAGQTEYLVQKYCADNNFMEYDVSSRDFTDGFKFVVVSSFANKNTAVDFYRQFVTANYKSLEPETDFIPFVINRTNYALVQSQTDMEAYVNFFKLKYL